MTPLSGGEILSDTEVYFMFLVNKETCINRTMPYAAPTTILSFNLTTVLIW